jgi:UDP-glucose:(heptosyl)LPS alpha-1,3-glucosyltransferase
MKLAVIRRQLSATGGAELYLQRLMTALVDAGHEVHLFAEAWSGQAKDVKLHAVPVTGTRATKPVRFAEAVRELTGREAFDCVFSLERTLKQDVYRAGDGVHRVWLERRRQFAPWWKRPFIGRGAFHRNLLALEAQTFDPANTRRIIVNSYMVKGEILRHFKFPEERIHLVRNGVDVKRFQSGKRAETRARFGVKDDEFLLLFVGSGWERKGLRHVLDSMYFDQAAIDIGRRYRTSEEKGADRNRSDKTKLLVVGKGKKPSGAMPNVMFVGAMDDLENAYAAADLFVFPPIYEPSSNVVYEALASGLRVVTTAQNGASELVQEGVSGSVLQNPADIYALNTEIREWYRNRRKPRLEPDVHSLSLERNLKETVEVLEQAAKERRA